MQCTAAEAIKGVVEHAGHISFLERGWWEVVCINMLHFVGMPKCTLDIGTCRSLCTGGIEEVVIIYISCQGVQRHLVPNDHEGLMHALTELSKRQGWVLNIVAMEHLTKEEQLALTNSLVSVLACFLSVF
jgi:hypothetical protein